ncbi:non-ribosomal peptide synthetase [Fusarium pseudoanthophilum]|uniref:Non-ribosomal peptide synthetase n=1 Tax=Fusarium pseudoanthophilum TaxID=48495 RepID=A0A8H5KEV7_9HYPO|nr:non-ribosomal peptide synthetase [Fusarium pseudoanthophilum]
MDNAMNNQVFNTVAIILNVAIDSLDLDSSFIQNGGDSLKATSLANHFRKRGIAVTREMILMSTSLKHLFTLLEYPSLEPYDVQVDSTSADLSTVLSDSDWQTVSHAEQDIMSSPDFSSFGASCSSICSSASTLANEVCLPKESLPTDRSDSSFVEYGAQQATEMQLALVHGTLKDRRMNMIRCTMVHRNEHINKLQVAWRFIVEQADIFDLTWAAPLTGTQHSRFMWVEDPSEDESKTAIIGSKFTVLSQDMNNGNSRVIWTVHHALIDGISAQLLLRNVLRVASGHAPSNMPSFWKWAQDLKAYQKDNAKLAKEFWSRQRQLHPEASGTLQLPKPNTSKRSNEVKTITLPIYDMRSRLLVAAKHSNVTLATMFYAAWALVLSSFSDSRTVVFGALLSGRSIPVANSDKVIGPVINSLPLYIFADPDATVQQFLASLFRSLLDLEQFSWTCTDHGFSRDYESTLSVEAWQDDWSEFDIRPVATSKSQQSDVPLGITVNTESLQFQYHKDRLSTVDAERIMSCYQLALEQITRVHTPIMAAMEALVSAPSRALLTKFGNCISGRTTRSSVSDDLVSLFSRCVERHADSIAVDDGAVQVTYRDLDIMTTCVATRITSMISQGDIVCVHSDKSLNWIVAIFGILKAGGVYSSLDPILPSELRATMFRNAKAKLFLTPKTCQLCQTPSTCDLSDSIDSILADPLLKPQKIDMTPKPWANAYLCFTSGSTGTPKGVMCTHEGLVAFQSDLEVRLFAQPGVRIAQVMSVAFDGSIHEIFSALTHGATLVLPSNADPLGALDTAHAAILTPSIARVLNPDDYPMLKWVYLVGEPVPQTVSDRWSSVKTVYNMYGPTEGTGGATIKRLTPGDPVTIGTPNPTTRIYILNSQGKLAHQGMIGEIYIAGVQVARGYVGLDGQTKDRFLPDTIMRNGETMYRTGDRGYWNEAGEVCCLGRNDRQIKLRGYRLDLNDLEVRISRAAPELSGVALARKQDELVAVVQPEDIDIQRLKAKISAALPRYAIPRHLVALSKIPMTPAGKVDYQAVSDACKKASLSQTESLSDMQRLVSCIVCKVLGIEDTKQVSLDSDFICLGGHSLKQMRLAQMLSETFKMRIPLQLILSKPSVRGLSDSLQVLLDSAQSKPPAVSCARLGDRVSPIEHEWLVKYQSSRGTASFNVCFASTFSQVSVCTDRLIWAWNQVLQRHEILSSRFSLDGEASKRYFDQAAPRVQALSDLDFWKQANRPFDLAQESPIRVFVAINKLMVIISHVVADYTTLSLLLRDASQLYHGHQVQKRPIYADSTSLVDVSSESVDHFWRDYLRDLPQAPKLLRDSPLRTTYQGRSFTMQLDHQLWASIMKLSSARTCSNQQLAIAVVAVCLHQDVSDMDMVIGVPSMHRQTDDELQTIGLFLQPLPIRVKHSRSIRGSSFLQSTQCSMQAAVAHATCWDRIVDALDVNRQYPNHPIFDIMVTFLDNRMVSQLKLDIPSFESRHIWANGAKFKLMFEFMEVRDSSLALRIEYDNSCISLHEVHKLASRVEVTLKMLAESEMDLDRILK